MNKIALNVIVGNGDAAVLERCLKSAAPAGFDEVVVTRTAEDKDVNDIAEKYATKNEYFEWADNFAEARNYCLKKTDADYVMTMDADDYIRASDALGFYKAFQHVRRNGEYDFYIVDYITGINADGTPTRVIPKPRIFRNCAYLKWVGAIHEYLSIDSEKNKYIKLAGVSVVHKRERKWNAERNLRTMELELDKNPDDARTRFYYAKEMFEGGDRERGVKLLEEFVDNQKGHKEELCYSCICLATHYAYAVGEETQTINGDTVGKAETYANIGLSFSGKYAELYVILGDINDFNSRTQKAISCFQKALDSKMNGVLEQVADYYGYIPADRLSILFYKTCRFDESLFYNKLALNAKPNDERTIKNRQTIIDAIIEENEAIKNEAMNGNGKSKSSE